MCFLMSLALLKVLTPSPIRNIKRELKYCRVDLSSVIQKMKCHPIMLRLAWSDAASYNCTKRIWPYCGGVNGSIRFNQELSMRYNGGLSKAIIILEKIKAKYDTISWADLIQMAGALAVELSGGPTIDMIYGRKDCEVEHGYEAKLQDCPAACPPFPDASSSADIHIRNVFYRLGFTNQEAVVLLGGHTLGRAFSERTGVCSHSSGEQGGTKYTRMSSEAMGPGIRCDGIMAGGISWTKNWLCFDNSYFQRIKDNDCEDVDLLWLPIDDALHASPEFKKYVMIYAEDNEKFLLDYAAAHKKMSEVGALFVHGDGIRISQA